jgi:hypothetical protein
MLLMENHIVEHPGVVVIVTNGISGWWYTYPSEKYESQWEG